MCWVKNMPVFYTLVCFQYDEIMVSINVSLLVPTLQATKKQKKISAKKRRAYIWWISLAWSFLPSFFLVYPITSAEERPPKKERVGILVKKNECSVYDFTNSSFHKLNFFPPNGSSTQKSWNGTNTFFHYTYFLNISRHHTHVRVYFGTLLGPFRFFDCVLLWLLFKELVRKGQLSGLISVVTFCSTEVVK